MSDDGQARTGELRGQTVSTAVHVVLGGGSLLAAEVEEWMAFFKDPDGRLLAIMAKTGG